MPVLHPKNQIPKEWLEQNAEQLFKEYYPWFCKFKKSEIEISELACLFLVQFTKSWRGFFWYGGKMPDTIHLKKKSDIKIGSLIIDCHSKFENLSLFEFLSCYQLRGVSLKAQRALLKWINNEYPIIFSEKIPTSLELLNLQCEGKRALWLPQTYDDFKNYIHGKDPLSFVIHDLKHADEFFFDQNRYHHQIEFYKKVLNRFNSGEFEINLKYDEKFKEEFEYIISDMNSHPQHLVQTLDAVLKLSDNFLSSSSK